MHVRITRRGKRFLRRAHAAGRRQPDPPPTRVRQLAMAIFAALVIAIAGFLLIAGVLVPAARPWALRLLIVAAILLAATAKLTPQRPLPEGPNAAAR
jgi:hypothetical protein